MTTRYLALTGGIASGKSTAAFEMERLCPGLVRFDSDACVRRLLGEDEGVIRRVRERFGEECLDASGSKVDRPALRAKVFGDSAARRDLERLLHPRVREECLAVSRQASKLGAPLFLAEVPLLFEGGFHFGQERNLVVAVSRATQLQRLMARSGFPSDLGEAILSSQMPMEQKVLRADTVFWNEGPKVVLTAQIQRFLKIYSHER